MDYETSTRTASDRVRVSVGCTGYKSIALREKKKAYLSRYRLIDAEINRLIEERDALFALATKITPDYGSGPRRSGHGDNDRLGDKVAKLTVLDTMIDRKVDELVELRVGIEGYISRLDDPVLRNLLAMKYINGLHFEVIAERLFYSMRQTMNLHTKALDSLEMD